MNGVQGQWLMLAFAPARGFAPAKSGKCWYRKFDSREAAIRCKRELVRAGIKYACKKVEAGAAPQKQRPSPTYDQLFRT